MSESEHGKFIRMICWMTLLLGLTFTISEKVNDYHAKKGVAVSRYIANTMNIDVPPEQAVYLDINLSQYDVEFNDFQIFPK
jgi:hypothetical protein